MLPYLSRFIFCRKVTFNICKSMYDVVALGELLIDFTPLRNK